MTKNIQKLLCIATVAAAGLMTVGCQTRTGAPRSEVLNRSADIMSNKAEGQSYVYYRETEDGRETYVQNRYTTINNRSVTEHLQERADGTFVLTRETSANMPDAAQIPLPKMRPVFPKFTEQQLWEMKQLKNQNQ